MSSGRLVRYSTASSSDGHLPFWSLPLSPSVNFGGSAVQITFSLGLTWLHYVARLTNDDRL